MYLTHFVTGISRLFAKVKLETVLREAVASLQVLFQYVTEGTEDNHKALSPCPDRDETEGLITAQWRQNNPLKQTFKWWILLFAGGVEHRARSEPGPDDPRWRGVQSGDLHHRRRQRLSGGPCRPHGEYYISIFLLLKEKVVTEFKNITARGYVCYIKIIWQTIQEMCMILRSA